jgi:tRNA(Ile)-lysidine synthase
LGGSGEPLCFFLTPLVPYAKMPPSLTQRVLTAIECHQMMRAGDRVGVAVSGGADSVAMLLLLLELREELGVVLSVVHFNHKLRGKASDADEKFVARLAAEYGLAFHRAAVYVAAKAKKERANLEETARRARYDYFHSLAESGDLTHVAVAHTADDQAETVLAHLLRGTGVTGLGGIHPTAGSVIRPLLKVRRFELREFLRAKKQNWREDRTNRDTKRMRARIRRRLLPLLEKQFQPAIVEHLASLADLAREDEAFFEAVVEERIATLGRKSNDGMRIDAADLLEPRKSAPRSAAGTEQADKKEAALAISKRIVRRMVKEVKPQDGQLGARHVAAVMELAESGHSGSSLQLPGGVEVRRERSDLLFRARNSAEAESGRSALREYQYNIDLANGAAELRVPEAGCVFRLRVIDWPAKRAETRDKAVLDRDRLRFPLVLRNWRPGDQLHPFGHRGPHKLKRLLNEKRISRWEREGWPVLTSGGVLVWARGFPVAAEFAADEKTRAGIVVAEETS